MQTIINTKAKEKSTYVITVAFSDENGDALVPKTMKWSLTDTSGTVINARDQVVVAVPAASNDIVLSGDDLQIKSLEVSQDTVVRVLIIEATYNSDLGSDLSVNDDAGFEIENLVKIT